ncbi:MAG: bifunctional demethylmenaquinone methyltransferase/2-methoxy-6-polyprenyl-1,4-benzoquinol methylase UbiE [Flavobacteriaceae bacterium]|jgi:demethylmenaquinone methyltransferase/2-methoxy-6-polyprenyl-1,4-benzoquinol methylase|nr:bifunctional demethylmenaquinone methyltransferase/2-methoxy-6-polyprenyl-1,4-benzoquinol methylase UbiE [Flavobacteriaceae bacterium]
MKKSVTPYNQEDSKKKQVTEMFDGISTEYDALNRKISLGIDVKWRRRVVDLLIPKKPESILDIATGTGDLALALTATKASRIVGLDISAGMLSVGKDKVKVENLENTIEMVIGDSEALTYDDNSFDAVTVAFGVRNFENLELGLSELFRVLKPGGTLVVLETAVPTRFPFKQGYKFHTQVIIPLMGKLFTRDQAAYKYLSDSAAVFPHGKQFNNILEKMGFIEVEDSPQTLGVASIYCATKP